MTCLATNMAILDLGAKIVWADVDPKTGLLDYSTIQPCDAIVCVHWGGNPCNLEELHRFDKPVIEDACHALGSENVCKSKAAALSFQAIKTLTTGDGGAVVFQNEEDLERARLMKWFGLDRTKASDMRCNQDPPEAGYKMQMNNIAASIGIENLKHLKENLRKTFENAWALDGALSGHHHITNATATEAFSSNWLFTVLVNDSADFIAYMKNQNIECSKVHDRNDTKTVFASSKTDLPGVVEFDSRHVCVPCGWWLTEEHLKRITNALRNYKNGRHSSTCKKRRKSIKQDFQEARA
jgi:dTDP-4-amino-4,6-dideoxygalactose transaminase